jgi:hypothetical protein
MLRIGRAVLRERAGERGLLLVGTVLLLLAVESDDRFTRLHAIAEVGQDAADFAIGFRRDRHLIDGREGPDDVDAATHRFLLHRLDAHAFGRGVAPARLRRFGFRAGPGCERAHDCSGRDATRFAINPSVHRWSDPWSDKPEKYTSRSNAAGRCNGLYRCLLCPAGAPQSQRIGDHRQRAQRHRRAGQIGLINTPANG